MRLSLRESPDGGDSGCRDPFAGQGAMQREEEAITALRVQAAFSLAFLPSTAPFSFVLAFPSPLRGRT